MRKLLLGVVVTLLLSAGNAAAQWVAPANGGAVWPFACEKCGVDGWLDLPQSGASIASGTVLHGWGVEKASGHRLDRIDVWYEVNDDVWMPLKQPEWATEFGFYRPDVQVFFKTSGLSPDATAFTGWHLTLVNVPPPGARRIRLNLWYGPYMRYIIRTFTVAEQR